jgi:hypothetical protein
VTPRAARILIVAVSGTLLVWAIARTQRGRLASSVETEPGVSANPARPGKTALRIEKRFVVVSNQFDWSQVESEDYQTYIERLRAIGCPEQTIRDIIIADLDKLMAPRLEAARGLKEEVNYWEPEEERLLNEIDVREVARERREVEREKQAIVRELVGADLRRERLQQEGRSDYYERRLRFLQEDRRSLVRDVLEHYDDAEQRLRAKETEEGDALTLGEQQELRAIRKQRDAELDALLTPAEREQYELWMSPAANAVRSAFYGMQPTEQEFLGVYQARSAFEKTWGDVDPALLSTAERAQMEQARQQMEEEIRRQLGDQRYAEFKRGEDPDYHQLSALSTRFKLPREKAVEVYNYKMVLEQLRAHVRGNTELTPAQKEQALDEMVRETEKSVLTALGDRAYRYYVRTGQGSWIRRRP